MPASHGVTVDDYLAAQPAAARAVLSRVRAAILKALPRAEEGISYQIPVFKVAGRAVIYFAGWKAHWSLYPATGYVKERLAEDLAPYAISKGTIRFPFGQKVPVRLVARIARLRAEEEAARPGASDSSRRLGPTTSRQRVASRG
jgi:uncharacterized protein YdhG (YjbR/CyaY superfamily)